MTEAEFFLRWEKNARLIRPSRRVLQQVDGIFRQWVCVSPLAVRVSVAEQPREEQGEAALREVLREKCATGRHDGIFGGF